MNAGTTPITICRAGRLQSGTLYEHCVRAVVHGLQFGAHGLPLMGSGDWNDGMNRVGIARHGRERLARLLPASASAAVRRGRAAAEATRRLPNAASAEAVKLRRNLEQHAWDGGWYRRAYFDDGTPLGSAANAECRIDSIAQSWSVLSGAGRRASLAAGHASRRPAPRAPRPRADPAAGPAVRSIGRRPRLHPGLRPGRAGERRPVHARRDLGGDGVRRAGRCANARGSSRR